MNASAEKPNSRPLSAYRERCERVLVACENTQAAPNTLANLNGSLNDFLEAVPDADPTVGQIALGLRTVLDAILEERLPLNVALSDVLILTLDRIEESVAEGGLTQSITSAMNNLRLGDLLSALALASAAEQCEQLRQLTELLAPEVRRGEGEHAQTLPRLLSVLGDYGLSANPDLLFFASLATPAEARLLRWQGRHRRLLQLGLAMNRNAGSPLDSEQLAAALLVHDISMAFMPLDMLEGQEGLSLNEERRIHKHANISACLLENMPYWQEARQMTEQHHEWFNGEGYPQGLKGLQIHQGARLIAIVDAFEAITHPSRHHDSQKRPYLRAAMEINNLTDRQFCPEWVQVFNSTLSVLRPLLAH